MQQKEDRKHLDIFIEIDSLRNNEMAYSSNTPDREGIVLQLADGSIKACNSNAESILGIGAAEISGWIFLDRGWAAIDRSGSSVMRDKHPATVALRSGKPCLGDMGFYRPNGSFIWLLVNSQPLFLVDETSPYGVVTTFLEQKPDTFSVAKKRDRTSVMEVANERFALAAAAVNCLIYDWDLKSNRVERTCGLTEILGYQPEETEPTLEWWHDRIYPEDLQKIQEKDFWKYIATHDRYHTEYRVRHQDGHYLWVQDRQIVVKNDLGEPIRIVGSTTDISDRKKVEASLRRSEERYRSLVTATSSIVWLAESGGSIVSAPEWEAFTGQTPEQYIDWGWIEAIHPDDRQSTAAIWRKALQDKTSCQAEYRLLHRDGHYRYVRARGVPILDDFGNVWEWVGTITDISERQKAEIERKKNSEQLELAQRAARAGLWDWDLVNNQIGWSKTYYKLYGLNPATKPSYETWLACIVEEDREKIEREMREAFAQKTEINLEFRIQHPVKGRRWLNTIGNIFYNSNKQPVRTSGITIDITERKQAEEALNANTAILSAVNEATTTLIFAKDRQGRLLMANPAVIRLIGKPEAEILGRTEFTYLSDREEAEKIRKNDRLVMESERVMVFEEQIQFPDGIRTYLSTKSPYRDKQGKIIGLIGVSTDITERKQTIEQLEQQAKLLDLAYEAILVRNLDGTIIYWNRSAQDTYGWKTEEAIGRVYHTLLKTQFAVSCQEVEESLLKEGHWEGEPIHTRRDGVEIIVESRQILVRDGSSERILEVNRNITARKQAEEDLRRSEEFNRRILDSSYDCIKVLDLSGKLLYINGGGQELLEIDDPTTFLNSQWTSFWQDTAYQAALDAISTAKEGGIGKFQGYCPTAKGKPKWWEVIVTPIPDATGKAEKLLSISRDITERQQAEIEREQILARLQKYASQLQGLTEAALAINAAMTIEEVLQLITQQGHSLIGTHQAISTIVGDRDWSQPIHSIYLSDKYQAWQNYREQPCGSGIYAYVCQTNQAIRMTQAELEAHPYWRSFGKSAGQHPPLRGWLAAPLVAQDGSNIGLIQLSDKYEGEFTEEDEAIAIQLAQMASIAIENVRLYEAQQNARSQAEAANRVKDEFLAILSHELRSPLNPILGWTQMLQTYQLDADKIEQAIITIERNAKLLTQLIDDLLDIARILRGKLILNVTSLDLELAIEAAIETVRTAADAKSIAIETDLLSVGQVRGDFARLQQIIWNLLANAVKFTPDGGRVTIKLERVGDRAQISVNDTGKGISREFLPHVFECFRQADASVTRTHGGLGLGLAIVRHLVELHGGEVSVNSLGIGQGATFTVQVPLILKSSDTAETTPAKPELEFNSLDLEGIRVLVVDDDFDNREFFNVILEQYQAKVMTVASAREVSSVLRTFKPHILISDIGMPDIDGYTLLRSIRCLSPEQGGTIPAIAVTAYARAEDTQKALESGFQRHFSKPIEAYELITAIVELVRDR
jgi:PAS domain S-box-containing protein